jgi:hypothetical protein
MTVTKSTTTLHHSQWKIFNFTQSFDTSLPLGFFFLERSPYSNLFVAPQLNVRQVDPLSYNKITDGKMQIVEAIKQEKNTTLSVRKMVLYPFVITKQDDAGNKGVALVSVARGQYQYQDQTLKNTSVIVTNINATNVKSWDVQRLAALFNQSTHDQQGWLLYSTSQHMTNKTTPLIGNICYKKTFH